MSDAFLTIFKHLLGVLKKPFKDGMPLYKAIGSTHVSR